MCITYPEGGHFTKFSVGGSACDKKWTQRDLRFCKKNEGSKRSKNGKKGWSTRSKIKEKIGTKWFKMVK